MRKEKVTAAAFLIPLILLSVLSAVLPQKTFSESENRYLAGKPKFTFETFKDGSYGKKYESWLSDQFPFRAEFVAAKTNADRLLLREDVNGVYFGKDQYYIEKIDPEQLATEQMRENVSYLASGVGKFASLVGDDRVKVMLVPSASQILKEKLPVFAAPADQSLVTRLAKDYIKDKTGRTDVVLGIEEALAGAAKEPIYYKTDHHWTSLGAYYAYCLYGQAAGFQPWEREAFTEDVVSDNFQGTIQAKLGVPLSPDRISLFIPNCATAYQVYYDGAPNAYDTLYNKKALEKKDQYAVFLDGNHGLTKIRNEKQGDGIQEKKLLIVKDSFAHSFAPFVINHFEEVHMVDLRYFNMKLSQYIESQEITDILVLYQIPGFAKDGNLFKIVR